MTLGRSLAFCTHPGAAWRRLSSGGRLLLLTAYFSASYVLTLAGLLVVSLTAG